MIFPNTTQFFLKSFVHASLIICLVGCTKQLSQNTFRLYAKSQEQGMLVWDQALTIEEDLVISNEVTIMPQAFIRTINGARVTFQKKVNILGESMVFDLAAALTFEPGTISEINPVWFGAKGYDQEDDTHAFQKALSLAMAYSSVASIVIPVGRYYISETLECKSTIEEKKPIHWFGRGMSNSGVHGASLSWRGKIGGSLIRLSNISQVSIEYLDFKSEPGHTLKHNLDLKPFIHSVFINRCSFFGCGGEESANINLNAGNGDQVSEIHIEKCAFNGLAPSIGITSLSAIRGGLANTKNFYIKASAFDQYADAAIDVYNSDMLHVETCTFSNNEIDISCLLCGTYAISNYSEHSKAFFRSGFSSNLSFTTLINNNFTGKPTNGWVIADGAGSLILLNNNFGGTDQREDLNRVRWEQNEFSPIYSVGNFYKNAGPGLLPFYNRSGQPRSINVTSIGDIGGKNALGRKKINAN